MKIAFDLGGVITKYPTFFRNLIKVLRQECEVYIISDIPSKEEIVKVLEMNNFEIDHNKIYSADYKQFGEMCKAVLCSKLKIDCIVDDLPAYLSKDNSVGHAPIRLHLQPDAFLPYFADEWKNDKEYEFGRNKYECRKN